MKAIVRVPVVIGITASAVCLGLAGIQASTQCVRFLRQKVAHHHKVSAATAARWAAWDKAHPNWHPKPTPKEVMSQVDFACQVPLVDKQVADALPTPDLAPPLPLPLDIPAPPETPLVVASNTPPTAVPLDQPSNDLVSPPIYSPQYPELFGFLPARSTTPTGGSQPSGPGQGSQPPVPTPEPSTWVMMGTAMLAMGSVLGRRRQMVELRQRA
jgi:hypothetical protein